MGGRKRSEPPRSLRPSQRQPPKALRKKRLQPSGPARVGRNNCPLRKISRHAEPYNVGATWEGGRETGVRLEQKGEDGAQKDGDEGRGSKGRDAGGNDPPESASIAFIAQFSSGQSTNAYPVFTRNWPVKGILDSLKRLSRSRGLTFSPRFPMYSLFIFLIKNRALLF